ncbi:ISP domain-containing protein [Pyrenochaeta sp. DS3sAY3a]|nr:ISP domain-containing protein [Pyrenochaeta sp. DS3sAY3a]
MAPFAEVPINIPSTMRPVEVTKERDILDGWWDSEDLFALERRALHSKTWICIAHRSRFTKSGDYISFELAGFPLLIILGKDGTVRAFHNVCRHRAYTITKKAAGSSLVLGCRYHGWSYDTKGRLVKAPQFDGIEGFDKTENSLFAVHTCTDRSGFVHVNLDARKVDHPPEYEGTGGFAGGYGIGVSSKWLSGWELNGGAFNWKTVGASDRTGIGTPEDSTLECLRPDLDVSKCEMLYVAPAMLILAFPDSTLWAMVTVLPASAGKCVVKCDVFTSDSAMTAQSDSDTRILEEYCNHIVHSFEEEYKRCRPKTSDNPPNYAQLKEHVRLERLAGSRIYPARRQDKQSESFCKAEQLCNEVNQMAKLARVDSVVGNLDW